MGITAPFEEGGFTKILADEALKVDQIAHRSIIEVTKNGTVGAASTAISFVPLMSGPSTDEELVIDKPFLFYVHDKIQKTILFAGRFSNPNAQ